MNLLGHNPFVSQGTLVLVNVSVENHSKDTDQWKCQEEAQTPAHPQC